MPGAVVGLDFSLRSPGICVLTPSGHTHLAGFYGFEPKTWSQHSKVTIHLFRAPPKLQKEEDPTVNKKRRRSDKDSERNTEEEEEPSHPRRVESDLWRYDYVTNLVVDLLTSIFPDTAARPLVKVAIESYAFYGRGHTGNNYKLHEVTGCCKLRLFRAGFTNWMELPASTWRRRCFGSYRAEKKDAYDFVMKQFPELDLLTPCHRKLGRNGTSVPCPVQDMCEAFCIARAASLSENIPPRHKKKKKTKEGGKKIKREEKK